VSNPHRNRAAISRRSPFGPDVARSSSRTPRSERWRAWSCATRARRWRAMTAIGSATP